MLAKDLKNIVVPLTLCDKTYNLAFDFNAMAEIDEVYEGGFTKAFQNLGKGKKGMLKALQALIYGGIKPRTPSITYYEAGMLMTELLQDEKKMEEVSNIVYKAFQLAFPQLDEGEQKPQTAKKK